MWLIGLLLKPFIALVFIVFIVRPIARGILFCVRSPKVRSVLLRRLN